MTEISCSHARTRLADHLIGELPEQDAAELGRHLETCPSCQAEARAFYKQERALTELAARANAKLRERIHAALLAQSSTPRERHLLPVRRTRRRWIAALVAACLLFVPVLALHYLPGPQQSPPQAQFESVQGEVFVGPANARVRVRRGSPLLPGQVTSVGENGAAVIAFSDATRLVLGAVTTVTWSPFETPNAGRRNSLFLAEGALTADMNSGSLELLMVVTTPQAEVVADRANFTLFQTGRATQVEAERGTVQVRRLKDGQAVAVPSGNYAMVMADGPAPQVQRMPQRVNEARATLQVPGGVSALQFAADGSLAAGSSSGKIYLFDPSTGAVQRKFEGFDKPIRTIAVADNSQAVAAGVDRFLAVWKLREDAEKPAVQHPASTIFGLRFVDEGKAVIGCSYDRIVRRIDIGSGKLSIVAKLKNYQSDFDFPAAMEFSPNGQMLAWGLKDNTTRLWDIATATEKHVLREHEGAVTALAFDAVEAMLATGSRDKSICLWDLPGGKLRNTLHGHRHTVNTAAFSPDCRLLATGSSDMTVKVWDVAFAREVATFRGHTGAVLTVSFSPDSKMVASGSADGTVKLWNVE